MSKRPVVHIEIPASIPAKAAEFYREMFGWEHQTDDTLNYTSFSAEGVGGGFPQVGDNGTNVNDVVVYIGSGDLEADLAKIEQLGGQRLSDGIEIPGMGRFAYFADPTGNRLALWQPAGA